MKCVSCGKPRDNHTQKCDVCREKKRVLNKRRNGKGNCTLSYHRRKEAGLCVGCGKPRDNETLKCSVCRERKIHTNARRGDAVYNSSITYNHTPACAVLMALYRPLVEQQRLTIRDVLSRAWLEPMEFSRNSALGAKLEPYRYSILPQYRHLVAHFAETEQKAA